MKLFGVLSFTTLVSLSISPTLAQPILDGTLGTQIEQPEPLSENFLITGGTMSSDTLFHSFEVFDIDEGQQVYFANPVGIENIFSRVTGITPSDINGTLGVNGDADLFLLNPNGILFGPNAQLDLSGSFVASTAERVLFEDGSVFSAALDQPQAPLLTINAPIGLQFGSNPGGITSQGVLAPGNLNGMSDTLAFVGGDINITDGTLLAPGAIELVSVGSDSLVTITSDERGYQLDPATDSSLQDINIVDTTIFSVSDFGGRLRLQGDDIILRDALVGEATSGQEPGDGVYIQANKLRLLGSSSLASLSLDNGRSGDIVIEASDLVEVIGNGDISVNNSFISNGSGNIFIVTSSLKMSQAGSIFTGQSINENSGRISIESTDVQLSDPLTRISAGSFVRESDASQQVQGGEVLLQTARLLIENGASIFSGTIDSANSGDITINAADWIHITGVVDDVPFPNGSTSAVTSSISALTTENATGDAGNITINTPNLWLTDGGRILSNTQGVGDAGTITLNVGSLLEIEGFTLVSDPNIGIVDSLITASSRGEGKAGGIIINSQGGVRIQNSGTITTASTSNGASGNIHIYADWLHLLGDKPEDDSVDLRGTSISAETLGSGAGGEIILRVDELLMTDEAFISSRTTGTGDGGDIDIKATESVRLIGQAFNTDEFETGIGTSTGVNELTSNQILRRAGNTTIETPQLFLLEGAFVTVAGIDGSTGVLEINADLIRLDNGSLISAIVDGDSLDDEELRGGEIFLSAADALILSNESRISATALNSANGGNINIDAGFVIGLPPIGPNGSDIIAKAIEGEGGRITISANAIYGLAERPAINGNRTNDIDASSEFGTPGEVNIFSPDLDPEAGLIKLPTALAPSTILQACQSAYDNSSSRFIDSGRGGVASTPGDPLGADSPWQDTRHPEETRMSSITEAQGWQINESGYVELLSPQSVALQANCS